MSGMDLGGPVWSNGSVPEGTVLGRPVGGGVKPLTPAEVATILSTPSSSTIGNLLTANQAGCSNTAAFYPTNATLSAVSGDAGSSGIRLTSTFNGTASVYVNFGALQSGVLKGDTPVQPGMVYTAVASVRSDALTLNVNLILTFFAADRTTSVGTVTAGAAALSTSWRRFSATGVAPANAAYAVAYLLPATALSIGDTYDVSAVGIWAGAGGLWAMPGVPIVNTGRRVTHPNTDDVLVQAWDSTQSRWQVAHYDTGRRSLTLANGWTATAATVRRVGYAVEAVFTGLNGASASSGTVVTLDSSLRPPFALAAQIGNTASTFPDKVVTVGTDGTVVVGGTYTNVTAGSLSVRMFTAAAIPTSLPGTLVSSAPYN